jgi:hypothetical protein
LQVPGQHCRFALIDLAAQGGDADFQYFLFAVQWLFIPLPHLSSGALSMRQLVLCQDKQKMDFMLKIG